MLMSRNGVTRVFLITPESWNRTARYGMATEQRLRERRRVAEMWGIVRNKFTGRSDRGGKHASKYE